MINRNSLNLLSCIFVALCLGCNNDKIKDLRLSRPLPKEAKLLDTVFLYTDGNNLKKGYHISYSKLIYTVCLDSNNLMDYIITGDTAFVTNDGLKVGLMKKYIPLDSTYTEKIVFGFGYNLISKKGWSIAFIDSVFLATGSISDTSRIVCFFKSR
jgi:hypothetical protein